MFEVFTVWKEIENKDLHVPRQALRPNIGISIPKFARDCIPLSLVFPGEILICKSLYCRLGEFAARAPRRYQGHSSDRVRPGAAFPGDGWLFVVGAAEPDLSRIAADGSRRPG